MTAVRRLFACLASFMLPLGPASGQAMDVVNPTCPARPNWSDYPTMQFSVASRNGMTVLQAEGRIDASTPTRLQAALDEHQDVEEIWLRSPGGDARAGSQAGFMIRESGLPTRIPAGWTCFSACNFMFMGGVARFVDRGGVFMVHMFTHVADGSPNRAQAARGGDGTVGLIGEIEQASALLATEDNDFLIRMGISRSLLSDVMYRVRAVPNAGDRETRRCLSDEEVRRYNVASGTYDG